MRRLRPRCRCSTLTHGARARPRQSVAMADGGSVRGLGISREILCAGTASRKAESPRPPSSTTACRTVATWCCFGTPHCGVAAAGHATAPRRHVRKAASAQLVGVEVPQLPAPSCTEMVRPNANESHPVTSMTCHNAIFAPFWCIFGGKCEKFSIPGGSDVLHRVFAP